MGRGKSYSFYEKKPAEGARFSVIISICSLTLLLFVVILSFAKRGSAGAVAGAAGICGLLLSLEGFIVGAASFRSKEAALRMSVIGTLLGGGTLLLWLTILLTGIHG